MTNSSAIAQRLASNALSVKLSCIRKSRVISDLQARRKVIASLVMVSVMPQLTADISYYCYGIGTNIAIEGADMVYEQPHGCR